MRKRQSQPISSADASGAISAENYVGRAVAHVKATGGEGFVIRAYEGEAGSLRTHMPPTPGQWSAWMAYFGAKRIAHAFALDRGMTTVPAEWPELFDVDWDRQPPPPLEPPRDRYISPDRRRQLAALLRSIGAGLGPAQHQRVVEDFRRLSDE